LPDPAYFFTTFDEPLVAIIQRLLNVTIEHDVRVPDQAVPASVNEVAVPAL
jgi:hypothetical protein